MGATKMVTLLGSLVVGIVGAYYVGGLVWMGGAMIIASVIGLYHTYAHKQ